MYVRFRKGCYINSEMAVLRNVEFHPTQGAQSERSETWISRYLHVSLKQNNTEARPHNEETIRKRYMF